MSFKDMEGVELKKVTGKVAVKMFPVTFPVEGESRYSTYLDYNYSPDSEIKKDDVLAVIEVEYEIPTDDRFFDMMSIEALKKKKRDIIAKSRKEQTEIEGKIQKLMAIEHQS